MADKKQHLIPLPEGQAERPFVLVWAEKAALEKLKTGDLTFSEDLGGLQATSIAAAESFETTGGPQNEGADTTLSY